MDNHMHIGPLIHMISKAVIQRLDHQAAKLELTSTQLFVLHYLCKNGKSEICQRDIEEEFELTHATVSGIISRLEQKEFVKCEQAENDKRFKRIIVTEKAVKCDDEMHKNILSSENDLMQGFSDDEKEQLLTFLLRMINNFEIELPHHRKMRKEIL